MSAIVISLNKHFFISDVWWCVYIIFMPWEMIILQNKCFVHFCLKENNNISIGLFLCIPSICAKSIGMYQ